MTVSEVATSAGATIGVEFPAESSERRNKVRTLWQCFVEFGRLYLPSSSLGAMAMAWHVDMTWHNLSGLIQSLTLPGHYWITLTIHAFKLALGQAPIIAPVPTAPARRVLHGLYAV